MNTRTYIVIITLLLVFVSAELNQDPHVKTLDSLYKSLEESSKLNTECQQHTKAMLESIHGSLESIHERINETSLVYRVRQDFESLGKNILKFVVYSHLRIIEFILNMYTTINNILFEL